MLSPKRARLQVSLCCDPADFIRSPHEGTPSVATGMPANGFPTFPADKRDHQEPRERVGPPPAKPCVEAETYEENRG